MCPPGPASRGPKEHSSDLSTRAPHAGLCEGAEGGAELSAIFRRCRAEGPGIDPRACPGLLRRVNHRVARAVWTLQAPPGWSETYVRKEDARDKCAVVIKQRSKAAKA